MPDDPRDFSEEASTQLGLRSLAAGFTLALLLQSISFFIGFSQEDEAAWVLHSAQVTSQIDITFSSIQDLETGQRGFLLTEDEAYLEPFYQALELVNFNLDTLTELVADNATQTAYAQHLTTLTHQKIAELSETIDLTRSARTSEAISIVQTDRGKRIMDDIREVVEALRIEENTRLANHVTEYDKSIIVSRVLSGTAFLVALAMVWMVLSRGNKLLNRSIKDFVSYRNDVEQKLISEQEKANSANEAKSNFLASMSHELRTPLNAIIGFSEILYLTADKPNFSRPKITQYAHNIHSSGQALLDLVNDVLDFAKIESDNFELHNQPFRMADELTGIAAAFELKAKDVDTHIDLFDGDAVSDLVVDGDAVRMRQVLLNLIDNAIKFTKGGYVTAGMRAEQIDEANVRVVIEVSDTGIGIPDDRLDMIFDKFSQADPSITRSYGGTGLGLPISQNLCRLMGGDLTVKSEMGVGSTFTASFVFRDLTVSQQFRNFSSNSLRSGPLSDLNLKVLLVDDNAVNIETAAAVLDEMGCTVVSARGGLDGVATAKREKPDAVLMDIHMPGVDGAAAARMIQDKMGDRAPPIFAWTADVSYALESSDADVNWAGKMFKPTTVERLAVELGSIAQDAG